MFEAKQVVPTHYSRSLGEYCVKIPVGNGGYSVNGASRSPPTVKKHEVPFFADCALLTAMSGRSPALQNRGNSRLRQVLRV